MAKTPTASNKTSEVAKKKAPRRLKITSKPGKSLAEKAKAARGAAQKEVQTADEVLDALGSGEHIQTHVSPKSVSNNLWEMFDAERVKKGFRLVSGPQELWDNAVEYFKWVRDNPLYEAKTYSTQRGLVGTAVPKMRAMTNEGLCLFLGISHDTWMRWSREDEHPDLAPVAGLIRMIIKEQKFTGAAADLLNASLIAKDLGLADRQEISGPDGEPIEVHSVRDLLAARLQKLGALGTK